MSTGYLIARSNVLFPPVGPDAGGNFRRLLLQRHQHIASFVVKALKILKK
jgi:hypothetical protein